MICLLLVHKRRGERCGVIVAGLLIVEAQLWLILVIVLLVSESDLLVWIHGILRERMLVKLLKEIEDLEGYVVQQELRDLPGTDEVRPHLILNQEPISKHSLKNLLVLGSNILEFLCQLIIAKCDDCPFQLRHFLVVLQQLMLCLDVVVQVVDLVLVVLLLLL